MCSVLVLVPLLVLVPVLVRVYMLVTCTRGQVHVPVLAVVRVLVLALHRLLVLQLHHKKDKLLPPNTNFCFFRYNTHLSISRATPYHELYQPTCRELVRKC